MVKTTTDESALEDRVRAFQHQLAAWVKAERPGLPVFALPGTPPVHRRRCVSSGARIKRGRWRCDGCLAALHEVLEPGAGGQPSHSASVGGADARRDASGEQAEAELAKRCRALGIPEEFRPGLIVSWYDRGENANAKRRTELRRLALAKIDALAQQARVAIETAALDGLTQLAAGALESAEAQAFLAKMPTVEALMPALDVSTLGPLALPGAGVRWIP